MLYNKCYQCQEKDQVLGTSFCGVKCKELYLKSKKSPKLDSFAEKLAKFRELHVMPTITGGLEYMEKLFAGDNPPIQPGGSSI